LSDDQPTSSPPPGTNPLWGGHGAGAPTPAAAPQSSPPAGGTRHPFGDEPLNPLSRRLLRTAGLLSVLLALVIVNSLVNGGGSSPAEQLELNPVASAAERVEKFGGGRMSLYVTYSSPALPGTLTASGSGAFNEETERSRITLDVKNPLTGESVRVIQISDGDGEYDGGSAIADELPPGKAWVRTESDDSEEDETPLNMEDSLEMLGSGEVEMVGREAINGKMTRRYRGEIRLSDLIDLLRQKGKDEEADAYERIEGVAPTEISAESWVDGKNLLRRFRMVIPMPDEPGEPPVTVDMRMDFFDYGAKPDIQIPDPASVVDGPLEDEDDAPSAASIS